MMKLAAPLFLTLATALALGGCGDDKGTTATRSASGSTAASTSASAARSATAPASAAPSTAKPDPQEDVDHIKLVADHVDPKKGKVEVVFSKWTVKKASFDPANLEGGTAEIEVDPLSLSSGVADRDKHLKSPDYLDAAKFATATVKVDKVKKTGDKAYSAEATISIHGIEKKWSMSFEVVSSTADSVRIKFAQPFNRRDFEVGGKGDDKDTVKLDVELRGLLTLKKT
ncbi:MAG: YceI family protein [Myxococcales bacterium]|nr:YceI family protein [Myxococcales bacterium]